jgi:myo-inositol-1-phosphate synthase
MSKPSGNVEKIRVGIAGIGNCASSLVQGVEYYRSRPNATGYITKQIGPFAIDDINFVAAFDIDARKVGLPLSEAIFSEPNCTLRFVDQIKDGGPAVRFGPILDGVAPHTEQYPEDERILVASGAADDVVDVLRDKHVEVLVCYLPVGSENAVRHYAEACLRARVAFVNCVPVFIASDPVLASQFSKMGIPLIGDDVRSQVGATIVHQRLVELLLERGYALTNTYQLNIGGNSDFLNMLDEDRLKSKRRSKTNAVTSRFLLAPPLTKFHIGPSDYVRQLMDRKIAYIHGEALGFGGAPLVFELRLQVEDSPNSAAVVVDVIRYAALARRRGIGGPLLPVSSYYMKSPPMRIDDGDARRQLLDIATLD